MPFFQTRAAVAQMILPPIVSEWGKRRFVTAASAPFRLPALSDVKVGIKGIEGMFK